MMATICIYGACNGRNCLDCEEAANPQTCEMTWLCEKAGETYDCTRDAVTIKTIDGVPTLLCAECNEAIKFYGADVVGVVHDDDETEDDETEKAA